MKTCIFIVPIQQKPFKYSKIIRKTYFKVKSEKKKIKKRNTKQHSAILRKTYYSKTTNNEKRSDQLKTIDKMQITDYTWEIPKLIWNVHVWVTHKSQWVHSKSPYSNESSRRTDNAAVRRVPVQNSYGIEILKPILWITPTVRIQLSVFVLYTHFRAVSRFFFREAVRKNSIRLSDFFQ